ncbi:MAG: hypothetical protein LBS69_07145 [Prevotellaceae bacterium]|jgi:hypothetical protein|nr:hypothetical protein [Prevotellaceae bacterium]
MNAEKHIETIFDHDITDKELDEFFSNPDDPWHTKEGYYRDLIEDESPDIDTVKIHLAELYEQRKDMKKAYKYAYQMKDKQRRQDLLNLLGGF